MKKRLHDKKAGIVILVALIIISLAEIIFRAITMGVDAMSTANFGEQLAVIALAATILILTARGKDRACFLCYSVWIGHFVFDQVLELPGLICTWLIELGASVVTPIALAGFMMTILNTITIIAIGALLLEYMNDGSIYNRAFNALCVITVLLIVVSIFINIYSVAIDGTAHFMLSIFTKLYRLTMVFLCSFFAYDSAKMQLKKVKFS